MGKIFITDSLTPRPGCAAQVLEAYMAHYAPSARARGLTLQDPLITPPVLLHGGSVPNRLTFVWTVPDLVSWWKQRVVTHMDPAIPQFWNRLEPMLLQRERSYHEAAAALV